MSSTTGCVASPAFVTNLTLVNYSHTKDALQMLNCPGKAQCLEEGGGGSISVLSTPYDQHCLVT